MWKAVLTTLLISIGSFCLASPSVAFFQEQGTGQKAGTAPASTGSPGAVAVPAGLVGLPAQARTPDQSAPAATQAAPPAVSKAAADPGKAKPEPKSSSSKPATVRVNKTAAGIKLNFSDAPIDRVVRSIMQELGYSYVIDPQVQGNVNIFTVREIPKNRLFEVLEQLLKMNGQAIVKQEDFYVILPIGKSPTVPHGVLMEPPRKREGEKGSDPESESDSSAEADSEGEKEGDLSSSSAAPVQPADQGPELVTVGRDKNGFGLADEQGVITYIIPLHYIPSDQMLQMAQAFISNGATVVDFAPANMLLLTDYTKNVQQVLNLVEMLDTQYFSLNSVDPDPDTIQPGHRRG